MGLFSNKISRKKVQPGDHIYTWRTAHTYAHHGIYVGDGKVVHYTHRGPKNGIGVISSSLSRLCLICKDNYSFTGDKVITSCLDCFLAGGKLFLYKYNVSRSAFLANPRGGTCTLAPSDPPEDVLLRAKFHLDKINGWFGDYQLTENNCEDFAIYCKTGLLVCEKNSYGNSGQVNTAVAATLALVVHACGLSMVAFGLYCYARIESDVSKNDKLIKVTAQKLVSILNLPTAREEWLRIAGSKFRGKNDDDDA